MRARSASSSKRSSVSTRCSRAVAGAQLLGEAVEVAADVGRDRLAAEVPDDGAQLPLRVERDAVVDAEDAAVVERAQAVTALAVGVVDHDVERGHAPERVGVLFEQREVVLLGIVLDEALHHADAGRAVAQARCRARCPSRARPTPRTPRPRGGTACRAGSPTAAARRVAACRSRASRRRRRRGSRGTSRSTTTASGRARRRRRRAAARAARSSATAIARARQFQRGQMCPSGSIGKSHSGQRGRPPSTAATPLRIIARICARVA